MQKDQVTGQYLFPSDKVKNTGDKIATYLWVQEFK